MLSVLTFASAIARVFTGLDTTTRPARLANSVAIAQLFPVASNPHLIHRAQTLGERPHPLRSGRESARLAHPPVLPDRDLRELPMHIQPDAPPPALPAHPSAPASPFSLSDDHHMIGSG
jgi:hypothetical protein